MNPAEAYKNAHVTSLEAHLSRAVTSCMHLRPADPVGYIGVRLISASAVAEPPTTTHPPATDAHGCRHGRTAGANVSPGWNDGEREHTGAHALGDM